MPERPSDPKPSPAPTRRALMGGAAALSCALLAPPALGAARPLLRLVRDLRAQWAAQERGLALRVIPAGAWPEAASDRAALQRLLRGAAAFDVARSLRQVPPRDQVHREVQALFIDLARAVSDAARAAEAVVRSLEEVEEDGLLRGGLRALRVSVADGARRDQLDALLDALSAPGSVRARLGRLRRGVARARRDSQRLAADPRGSGALPQASPSVQAEVVEGERAWGAEAGTPLRYQRFETPTENTRLLIEIGELTFGLAMLGFVFCGGYAVAVFGGILLLSTGPIGALFIAAGVLGMAIGAWGLVRVFKVTLARYDAPPPRLLRGLAPEVGLDVHGQQAWVPTGLERGAGQPVYVSARGRVSGPWGRAPHPGGDGLPAGHDALWPGGPEAGLIACVGGRRYALGPEATLPPGPPGEVELALNLSPEQAEACRGFIWARLWRG